MSTLPVARFIAANTVDRAITLVVVGDGAGTAGPERPRRLGSVPRLAASGSAWPWVFSSTLTSTARADEVQIEPDHVDQLVLGVRIVADRDGVDRPRLEVTA